MLDTMGLQVRAAQDATVQGNTNDICCTRKRGIILLLCIPHCDPLSHCSRQCGEWLRGAGRQRERQREAKERQFVHRPGLSPTRLCFHHKQPLISWGSLTDSSVYVSLLCDSYHTTEASSPSYSERLKYIFICCIQTWVPHTSTEGKWNSS